MLLSSLPTTNAASGGRRLRLRTATSGYHSDLENSMEGRGYFSTAEAYIEYLLRIDRFYRQFCSAMDQSQSDLLNRWELRDHLTWLACDLSHFGLTPLPVEGEMPSALRIETRASAFGGIYVILGSSLGAKLLASRAAQVLQGQAAGSTYLASLKSSKHWPGFLRDLEAEVDLDEAELIQGAIQTFTSYTIHMTRTLAP